MEEMKGKFFEEHDKTWTLGQLRIRLDELIKEYGSDLTVIFAKDEADWIFRKIEGTIGHVFYSPNIKAGDLTLLDDFECTERPNVICLN